MISPGINTFSLKTGHWNSAYDNIGKDYLGKVISGDNIIVTDSTKCTVSAGSRRIVNVGNV